MKAICVHQFGGPEVMKYEDAPDPKPAAGQVVVRVKAGGVNPVDTYIRAGGYGPREFPFTPGMDAAGVIESVGPGVQRLGVGERVYVAGAISGTAAELALCREDQVQPLPDKISFARGAGLWVPYGTAYRALFQRGGAKAGETLLIHGASGGVGSAAVQWAVAAGLVVIGTGGTDRGRELVCREGAHHVLDHGAPDYLKKLMDLTGGRGVDLILEMASHINLGKDLRVLAKNGRVVVIGSRGPVEVDARNAMGREADIRGMTLMAATEADARSIHAAIGAGLRNGTLRPIVGREFPLSQIAAAHEAVMAPGAYGKIVVVP